MCQYHIIWCPKFRYPVLSEDVVLELKKNIFPEIAKRYEYDIIEQEVMDDHIHLFVGAKPSVAPLDIVRIFKSISAIKIFQKFERLKKFYSRCGSMWSSGKFISSIGFVSEETIKKYIRDQKDNVGS